MPIVFQIYICGKLILRATTDYETLSRMNKNCFLVRFSYICNVNKYIG
nr:MAG TPA: hypothetical protein [Caudoviricetes sp.]